MLKLLELVNSPKFEWNLHIYRDNLFIAMIGLINNPSYLICLLHLSMQ